MDEQQTRLDYPGTAVVSDDGILTIQIRKRTKGQKKRLSNYQFKKKIKRLILKDLIKRLNELEDTK